MKVLHVFNRHRGGGGADNACDQTIALSRAAGLDIATFERDSRTLSPGIAGKAHAFASGLYPPGALADFRRTLAAERPDIVHVHELYPLISPWVLKICAEAGVPTVYAVYDFRMTCPIATHVRDGKLCVDCIEQSEFAAVRHDCRDNRAESAAYGLRNAVARKFGLFSRYTTRFAVLGGFTGDWLVERAGISADRIAIVPPAVDVPENGVDAGQGGYVAYAGRFVPEKGIDVAIAAARKLGIPLRLAGNESSHPAIRPGDDIQCIRTGSRDELMAFYRGARMLVVPSLWFETFCLVAAEASANGIPVVASRIGALQNTVLDGETGLLCTPGDADDLAEKMARLWNHPELCRVLGAGGRARVMREFDAASHVRNLLATYEGALGARAAA